ncbi:MAG: FtsQ-type POTRA domain-containing protein [Chloroflexi bacterium OHK40]
MDYNPPNTRERIAARRQQRRSGTGPVPGQQATPGARRALAGWLASGRLVALALFLAACTGLAYALTDARFSVQRVVVEGNRALDADAVAELSGLRGRPIWFVRPEAVVARLRENAYVASARVELALPDQARIRIVERRPEVRWQAGGVQYLVDGSGTVLGAAQEPAEADVLVITDNSHLQLEPNDQIDLDAVQLAQTLAIRLPVELGFTPAQLGWDYGLGVYVRSTAGQTIVFGQSEHLQRKLAVLDVLLTDGTDFTYLDLRPSSPFYQNTAPAGQAIEPPADAVTTAP